MDGTDGGGGVTGGNASGFTSPIWYEGVTLPTRSGPSGDRRADVCIVGAGITGLTAAYLMARQGKSVVVLDEKQVAGGETGRTSAHLASALDDRFAAMSSRHGVEATRLMYQSHAAAIDQIERIVVEESIECGFARLDGFLFGVEGGRDGQLEEELEAARRAGVEGVELCQSPPSGVLARACIRFPGQARFHPVRYMRGLAEAVERLGGAILCGSRVMELSGDGPVTARLNSGQSVTADVGIAATNIPTPINNWVGIYTKQASYRTYVIGMEVERGAVGDALYWDMADPYHYVRLERASGLDILLVGGEDHKTGQIGARDGDARFRALEEWARAWFPGARRVVSRWSGQVAEPDDGAAFIGRVPTRGHKACYVITGDSGMGLTHGTLGAMLVRDLVLGRSNPWERVYDPARGAWSAAGEFVKENVNAAAQLKDYLKPGEVGSVREIAPGCGAVVRDGLSRLAVYRDPQGTVHTRSAVCPHLKCVVRWNDTEKSWDCPCHGSRFEATGKLIMGPAVDDLPAPAGDEPAAG